MAKKKKSGGGGESKSKSQKPRRTTPKPPVKLYKFYKVDYDSGKIERMHPTCPRCRGNFFAVHQDRKSCGDCGYTEFVAAK